MLRAFGCFAPSTGDDSGRDDIDNDEAPASRLLCKRACCSQALRSPGEQASITFIPVLQASKGLCAVVEAPHQTPSTLTLRELESHNCAAAYVNRNKGHHA